MGRAANRDDQPWALGPRGERLTLEMLPRPGTRRWIMRRKAELVAAVDGKLLTVNELLRRYGITPAEYENWEKAVRNFGMRGLRTTRIQDYREVEKRFPDLERPVSATRTKRLSSAG
jgi:hypothetical protein